MEEEGNVVESGGTGAETGDTGVLPGDDTGEISGDGTGTESESGEAAADPEDGDSLLDLTEGEETLISEGSTNTNLTIEDIVEALESAEITATVVIQDDYTLWDKPLEEYTVTEGLLLILVLCAVGFVVQKFIGGILKCTSLLKK